MDREKVFKALEFCILRETSCRGCPYEEQECTRTLKSDVLSLLKEQEQTINALESDLKETLEELADKEKAQEPITPAGVYDNRDWDCGYCGYENPHGNIYCGCCGHLKKV